MSSIESGDGSNLEDLVLQYAKKCLNLKRTAKNILTTHLEIRNGVNECKFKGNSLQLMLQSCQMQAPHVQFYVGAYYACATMLGRVEQFHLKLQETAQQQPEWDGLAPVRPLASEWITTMARKDPGRLEKEMNEAKIKVDAAYHEIQHLKMLWNANKQCILGQYGVIAHQAVISLEPSWILPWKESLTSSLPVQRNYPIGGTPRADSNPECRLGVTDGVVPNDDSEVRIGYKCETPIYNREQPPSAASPKSSTPN
ncbi:unnamed protein product [Orchesella dallaii]|uniref:Uncharacterized protein n=1 Tax=Orchesella dallaii TaxID=48710 RepID=A0ABP1QLW4_9HEXA